MKDIILGVGCYDDRSNSKYWVLTEEQDNNNWRVIKLSEQPIEIRENENQEILVFDEYLFTVKPYYHELADRIGKNSKVCGFDCGKYNKELYGPCTSKFKKISSAGIVAGALILPALPFVAMQNISEGKGVNLISYEIDDIKIRRVVSKVKPHIDNYLAQKKLAEEYLSKKVEVRPIIKDHSGFYKENSGWDNLFKVVKNVNGFSDSANIAKFEYDLKFITKSNKLWNTSISQNQYSLTYKEEGYVLNPVIEIHNRHFDTYHVDKEFKNDDIFFKINKIIATSYYKDDKISFDYQIINNSNSYIYIKTISFYINGRVLTKNDINEKLPPEIYENKHIDFIDHIAYDYLSVDITKDEASSKDLKIAVAISYILNDKEKSLYEKVEDKIIEFITF
ncbi:MAG: hypothetical protein AB7S75_03260 [Desulfococcaceae bacterium]